MSAQRYNVSFEPELVARIDAVAGSRGRSAFLAAAAERELLSRRMGLSEPTAPVAKAQGRTRATRGLHEDAGAGGWRPGDGSKPLKKARVPTFDPSRFNQATRLR